MPRNSGIPAKSHFEFSSNRKEPSAVENEEFHIPPFLSPLLLLAARSLYKITQKKESFITSPSRLYYNSPRRT